MPPSRQSPNAFDARPLQGVRIRSWSVSRRAPYAEGAHEAVEVAWVESGVVRYRLGRQNLIAEAGECVVLPPGVAHATTLERGARAGSVWISEALLEQANEAWGRSLRDTPHRALRTERVFALGRLLRRAAAEVSPSASLECEALLEAMLLQVTNAESRAASADNSGRTAGIDPRLRRAVELVETHLEDALTVERLAAAACMSRYHFTRAFREATGLTPHRYVVSARVRRAAELLRAREANVTEAALQVGFNDVGRFARAFQREYGVLPSRFLGAS